MDGELHDVHRFLSVVVPIYNEEENVDPLIDAVLPVMDELGQPYEVILVNDGSSDGSEARLAAAAARHPKVKVINFRRNVGQTAAMMAGIDHAKGDIIIPMDGDLQNDPRDIGMLLAKLDEGYDVVSGWRKDRQDQVLARNIPSRVANWLISYLSGVKLNDYGCSLKAYRREVLQGYRLYGEMHRFIPIYAWWQGGRITEVPVRHHARRHGESKYGLNRIYRVIVDLLLVKFLTEYQVKPIYVFGKAALLFVGIALGSGLYAVYLKLFENTSFIQTPLPLLTTLGFITGVMCILLGFIAELLVRIYFESRGESHYTVRSLINFDDRGS
jgi:dolichol-phosphate mannosyltransferase